VSAIPNTVKEVLTMDIPDPEVHYEHKWLFVIIPVETEHDGVRFTPDTEALLAAYCKHCDSYYTKTLVWTAGSATEGHAGLPRWGCIGPEGRF
jgi:hypothetical protein